MSVVHSTAAVTRSLVLLATLALVNGCQSARSPFQRAAGDAAAALAGAATTLRYAHEGRIGTGYARANLASYDRQLDAVERKLAPAAGTLDDTAAQPPLELFRSAPPAVAHPCLDEACDWRGQVEALQRASAALREAGGG